MLMVQARGWFQRDDYVDGIHMLKVQLDNIATTLRLRCRPRVDTFETSTRAILKGQRVHSFGKAYC